MKRASMLVATCLALASSSTEAADSRAAQLTYEPWTKVCLGKSDRFIAAGVRGTCSPSGGAISINKTNGKPTSLSVTFATRRRLEGAIKIQIDQDSPIVTPIAQCFSLACTGKLEIEGALIERLKRSRSIAAETANTDQPTLNLSFSLAGFADVYDGPGSEPKAYEEILTREQLNERLRQSEERKLPECRE